MQIKLTDEIPIICRIRKLPFEHIAPVKEIVKDYIERGILRRSMSTYCSPGFLFQKKNKKWCLVVDYSRINKKALLINLPVPCMNQFIATSHGKKVFNNSI